MSTVPGDDTGLDVDVTDDEAALVPGGDPGLATERDRLARSLRDTKLQLAMTQSRLAALENSATLVLGRTLVRAARRPLSRGVQLPLELVKMWRGRGGLNGPGAATLALASAQLGDLAGGGERFLTALTAPGLGAPGIGLDAPGLVITGVLTAQSCATLAPDAAVYPLVPHDVDVMLESVGADLVLIEAAAMLAGSPVGLRRRPGRHRPRAAARPADRGGPRAGQAGGVHPQRARPPGARPGLGRGQLRRGVRRRLRRAAGPVQPDRAGRRAPGRPGLRRARGIRASRPRCGPCWTP